MATGAIRAAEENLRITLADCATFRGMVGATDRTQALARIHLYALPTPDNDATHALDELQGLRPFAIVGTVRERGYVSRWTATETYEESGRLWLALERNTPAADLNSPSARLTGFLDLIGAIEGELRSLSNQAGAVDSYLRIESFTLAGFGLSDEEERETMGDHEIADLEIAWGTSG